jgi:predicted metalloendopeptidase
MEPVGGIGFINVGVGADDKTALKTHLVRVGGLGLPDQDYYISEDKTLKKKEICTKAYR